LTEDFCGGNLPFVKPKGYAVQLDAKQLLALKSIKKRDGISVSEQLRRAIEMWLKVKS